MTLTLTLDPDLDIMKMYRRTKMKFIGQDFQKLEQEQARHTDRCTYRRDRTHYHPALAHTAAVRDKTKDGAAVQRRNSMK